MKSSLHFQKQQGVVLFIALIVLVALSLAGIALVRSVDTSNVIAGNLAFKQAALNAGDLGVEVAANALPSIIATSLDSNITTGRPYWYYATRRELDDSNMPTTQEAGTAGAATAINWNSVPVATTVSGNTVKVVIDRLCNGPTPVLDIERECLTSQAGPQGSKGIGNPPISAAGGVFYRVTVRVNDRRNTVSVVQAILER